MILAGDVGGTKSNLGVFREDDLRSPLLEQTVHSKDFAGLEHMVADFLVRVATAGPITRACFGIAGPVVNGISETPNLPWVIRAETIKEILRIDGVLLINDLVATGYGLLLLRRKNLSRSMPGHLLRMATPHSLLRGPAWARQRCIGMESATSRLHLREVMPTSLRATTLKSIC